MKACIAYHCQGKEIRFRPTKLAVDPKDTEWRTIGAIKPATVYPDEAVNVYMDNDSTHIDIAIRERVLPSASIKRAVLDIARKHVEETDEKPTKAMVAQWKEAFIQEHLPNAPIKETIVRVAKYKGMLFIGTSSAKLADDVFAFVRNFCIEKYSVENMQFKLIDLQDVHNVLHLALADNLADFTPGDSAKITNGGTGRKAAFSKCPGLPEAHDYFKDNHMSVVNDCEVIHGDAVSFVITEKGVFKSIKLFKTDSRMSHLEEIGNQDPVLTAQTHWMFKKDALNAIITMIKRIEGDVDDEL